jgi:hypothetical protein
MISLQTETGMTMAILQIFRDSLLNRSAETDNEVIIIRIVSHYQGELAEKHFAN